MKLKVSDQALLWGVIGGPTGTYENDESFLGFVLNWMLFSLNFQLCKKEAKYEQKFGVSVGCYGIGSTYNYFKYIQLIVSLFGLKSAVATPIPNDVASWKWKGLKSIGFVI